MKRKIVCNFWLPRELIEYPGNDFEIISPPEEINGVFSYADLLPLLKNADGFLIDTLPFDKTMIDQAGPSLKVIGRLGVGCDSVDYEYAGSKGIAVVNTPHSVTQSTAELAIALLLDAARNISRLDRKTRQDKQCIGPPSFLPGSTTLYGKTLGIVGFGRIGQAVGGKAKGLGLNILYTDIRRADSRIEAELNAQYVSQEELITNADFVSLHCSYEPQNHHLINEKTLSMMKKSAFLVNASRGKIIDEAALVRALKNKVICGAALDVYEAEPEISKELLDLDNVVLVPHIGTWSYDTRVNMAKESIDGICAYLGGGQPANIFNKEALNRVKNTP